MSTITLYGNVGYTSPYVLSVFVALEEKQLPFEMRARVRMVQSLIRSDFMPLREERSTDTFFGSQSAKPLSPAALLAAERLVWIAGRIVRGPNYLVSQFSLADVDLATMLQRLIKNGDAMPQSLVDYANLVWERASVRNWLARTQIGRR